MSTKAQGETAEMWVSLCLKAASEARHAEAEGDDDGPQEGTQERSTWLLSRLGKASSTGDTGSAASAAFLASLPPLTSRARTKAYIACVATGIQHRFITGQEGRALMYTAQMALAAHRPRAYASRKRTTTPPPIGFGRPTK